MLDYVYGYDELIATFVGELIPAVRGRGFGRCKTIGVIQDSALIAGLVYHHYNPDAETIEISGAALPGKAWLSRETIKRMYQYPFLGCRCQMVINHVPADDERQLRQLAAYGYAFIKVPRALGRHRDAVLCLLTIEDWQTNKFNKRLKHHEGVVPLEEAA